VKKLLIRIIRLPYFSYFVIVLAVNIAVAIIVLILRNNVPPTVPLFYGRAHGEDQLAPQMFLLLPPSISALVAIANTAILLLIEDKFLQKILIGISFAATLLSSITVFKIIFLVGSI